MGETQDAVASLATGARKVAIQPVQPGASVRVEHCQRRIFGGSEVLQGGNQHRVLEHIGVVACMEGVAVTEHDGAMVTTGSRWAGDVQMRWQCLDTLLQVR